MPENCNRVDTVLLWLWGVILSLFVQSLIPILFFVVFFSIDFMAGIVESVVFRRESWSWWKTVVGLSKGLMYGLVIVSCLFLDALATYKAGVNLHGVFTKSFCILLIGVELASIGRHYQGCGLPLPWWWAAMANKLRGSSAVKGGETNVNT